MSLWSRIANVWRSDRLAHAVSEELKSHIDEAIENGRDPAEARRAFGSLLATRDESRDIRLVPWLDSLRADVIFGWRQLIKSKVTSVAAILSLGLAVGACASAFRLVDAVLLRPLPIDHPERLYSLFKEGVRASGQPMTSRTYDYPLFRELRAAAKPEAELIAVSYSRSTDLTYGSDREMEKAYRQYVSGWMFEDFGLSPVLGRLFTEDDDRIPLGHPYAVLSHDYWKGRFAADPSVIGKTFRLGKRVYEIVGVVEPGFNGIQPGTMTEIFIPTMMNASVENSRSTWFQTLAIVNSQAEVEPFLARLQVTFASQLQERARGLPSASRKKSLLSQKLILASASAGASPMQARYREALVILSILVLLVLLIACANLANLMAARASSRSREMALRVAIGAGRRRLAQLALIESALVTVAAAIVGGVFAWWSAPVIVDMIDLPSGPARLALPVDWRLTGFGLGLTLIVTVVLGLVPALRASAVRPAGALKGGDDPHTRRPLMGGLIGAQVAFCFVVLFVAGLFVVTFHRLANQPIGYSAERLLAVNAVAMQPRTFIYWNQVADHLRALPGVETASLAYFPLMGGSAQATTVSVDGGPLSEQPVFVLGVSPGWIDTMKIPLLGGRDFRPNELHPSTAIVNVEFAKEYFNGEDPIGKSFEQPVDRGKLGRIEVVGLVGNAKYDSMHQPMRPTIYVPFGIADGADEQRPFTRASFIVRTSMTNSLGLAETLRREVPQARSEFYVSNVATQHELNDSHMVHERLLAVLALFFACVALILSAVGIYGVLHYSVVQRQREIGICVALGAQAAQITRRVTTAMFTAVITGSVVGLAVSLRVEPYVEDLLWGVEATEPAMLAVPALTILAALLAAIPVVWLTNRVFEVE